MGPRPEHRWIKPDYPPDTTGTTQWGPEQQDARPAQAPAPLDKARNFASTSLTTRNTTGQPIPLHLDLSGDKPFWPKDATEPALDCFVPHATSGGLKRNKATPRLHRRTHPTRRWSANAGAQIPRNRMKSAHRSTSRRHRLHARRTHRLSGHLRLPSKGRSYCPEHRPRRPPYLAYAHARRTRGRQRARTSAQPVLAVQPKSARPLPTAKPAPDGRLHRGVESQEGVGKEAERHHDTVEVPHGVVALLRPHLNSVRSGESPKSRWTSESITTRRHKPTRNAEAVPAGQRPHGMHG